MTPAHMRHLWSLIEACSPPKLLQLSDRDLSTWLMGQVTELQPLNHREVDCLDNYIQARLHLIRDMASARMTGV
jgi:hypothetical protein